jgi:hypothetical protein
MDALIELIEKYPDALNKWRDDEVTKEVIKALELSLAPSYVSNEDGDMSHIALERNGATTMLYRVLNILRYYDPARTGDVSMDRNKAEVDELKKLGYNDEQIKRAIMENE